MLLYSYTETEYKTCNHQRLSSVMKIFILLAPNMKRFATWLPEKWVVQLFPVKLVQKHHWGVLRSSQRVELKAVLFEEAQEIGSTRTNLVENHAIFFGGRVIRDAISLLNIQHIQLLSNQFSKAIYGLIRNSWDNLWVQTLAFTRSVVNPWLPIVASANNFKRVFFTEIISNAMTRCWNLIWITYLSHKHFPS